MSGQHIIGGSGAVEPSYQDKLGRICDHLRAAMYSLDALEGQPTKSPGETLRAEYPPIGENLDAATDLARALAERIGKLSSTVGVL